MSDFDQLPKSIKKAIRYIMQDAPNNKLDDIKRVFQNAFEYRENISKKTNYKGELYVKARTSNKIIKENKRWYWK